MDLKKNHRIDRHAVTHVKCSRCDLIQPKSATCTGCLKDFSKYYCAVCSLYDDKCEEKKIFHCDKCGMCKNGGKENTYHCDGCGVCYNLPMEENHVCVKDRLKQNCSVCLDDLHSSRKTIYFMKCNHNMHKHFYEEYTRM